MSAKKPAYLDNYAVVRDVVKHGALLYDGDVFADSPQTQTGLSNIWCCAVPQHPSVSGHGAPASYAAARFFLFK